MNSPPLKTKADLLEFLAPYGDDTIIKVMATDCAEPLDLGQYIYNGSPDKPVELTLILLDEDGLPILEE